MALIRCRECKAEVRADELKCPICRSPRPADAAWKGSGVDWRCNATIFGMPFIHIAFGRDSRGKLRVARGFIAIGQFAFGVVTVAQFGVGLVCGAGQFMLGSVVAAQFAGGVLVGLGQFASGLFARGQLAASYF